MSNVVIPNQRIIKYLKLSCQLASILEDIVKQEIVLSQAEKIGIQVSEQELQQASELMRIIKKLYTIEDTLAWLEEQYLYPDDFEELVRIEVTTKKLMEHLFSEQVESFFYKNQQDFVSAVIYEVFLPDYDLALDLFYSLTEKEITFNQVANEYISDPELRRLGGYKGIVTRQNLRPEISSAIFAAQPPQILRPMITSVGVHLIYVEEIIQPVLDDLLRSKILNQLFNNWLKQEMAEVEIVTSQLNGY